ncbi:KaiC domain protein, AF_0351 family [Halorientalis persicus]|uniref:KaiC domain protein, AF_0351 family n=1 Tax=Halorientalis persicus TaxID=1367881 RepID=A0A1H8DW19_9EURY|nr:KaiC domain-containing protein [Halorientalis persicus]SEN11356.1 KaiC domain protein, AF_0351 family [Halorientalis persicus]
MSEDDDWFESAVGDEDADGDEGEIADDGHDDSDSAGDDAPFGDDAGDAFGSEDGDDESPFGDESDSPFDGEDAAGGFDDGRTDEGDSPFGGGSDDDAAFGGSESDSADGESPFGGGGGEGSDPFGGGGSDESSPFGGGGGGGGDDGELFDDDFASAFGSAGGGGGGGGGSEFDDEDFESDIPRLDVGIQGLDDMIQGGIPRRHLIVTIGSAGTGKTTFGLQFLHHGLEKDDTEKAVFITLEQSHDAIMATADERDWNFAEHEAEDNLAIIDLDPVEMANSLQNIQAELPELIKDFGADRLVLDSVSLLEMMYDNQAKRRTQVFDFTRSLKKAGVTTMLTSEASESHEYASRHGIIEYLTDAVFHLRYVRQETRETRMAVEIQKIRNANHSRETKPYEITGEGISVYQQANIF